MKQPYVSLWILITLSFVIFSFISTFEDLKIGDIDIKTTEIYSSLTAPSSIPPKKNVAVENQPAIVAKVQTPAPIDTTAKNILFIGDSMLEGLSPRLASYVKYNGHQMNTVIWYSSTTEVWGESTKLTEYINKFHPDYIFICLGANELFVKDIKTKRQKYVNKMLDDIGEIPFVWIGPPNWKDDTGINDMLASSIEKGSFFLSNGMHFDRSKDGAHPTRSSAIMWMDSVASWMNHNARHRILMKKPTQRTAHCHTEILQPKQ